jgi:hypothetical protein
MLLTHKLAEQCPVMRPMGDLHRGECPVAGVSPVGLGLSDEPCIDDGSLRGAANGNGTPMGPSTPSGADVKQSKRATIKVCRVGVSLHLDSH